MVNVLVKAMDDAMLPLYKTEGASGADVRAYLPSGPIVIEPGHASIVPTGLYFQIPQGYEIQVRSRSGLAARDNVIVLNSPGTIDSDYRGEVKVILMNLSNRPFEVENGDRIAQLVLSRVETASFALADSLDDTERKDGGFGSTGRR
ncbi:MAG: dUTP diphosphatase [Candidatus Ornithospirochaeta sp.]|nr:dUTP diphosphatase [Candidatus Ornithospirochaeta sp.]